ncbi:general stress protein [Acrocarpospora catenulata]|uniref:general stress protein n=1 Tax=Acrocarpospora catenulata TaxID=2836182 RepID=UPI001BDA0B40|nr:general stress protein [Acrocarpospora catenulata]
MYHPRPVEEGTAAAQPRLLVSYDNYAAAQRAVDALSDAGFAVENVSIVGRDLRLEERVTGRLTNGRAALLGSGSGAAFGLVVGLFLGLFTTTTTSFVALVLWSVLWGAVAGAAFGYAGHAFQGGTRDFSSRSQIVAGRYDVQVATALFAEAQAILQGGLAPADTVVVDRPPSGGPPPSAGDDLPRPPGGHRPQSAGGDLPPSGSDLPSSASGGRTSAEERSLVDDLMDQPRSGAGSRRGPGDAR